MLGAGDAQRGGGRKACSLPHLTWRYLEFNSHAEIARVAPQQRERKLQARLVKVALRHLSSVGDAHNSRLTQKPTFPSYFVQLSRVSGAFLPCLPHISLTGKMGSRSGAAPASAVATEEAPLLLRMEGFSYDNQHFS